MLCLVALVGLVTWYLLVCLLLWVFRWCDVLILVNSVVNFVCSYMCFGVVWYVLVYLNLLVVFVIVVDCIVCVDVAFVVNLRCLFGVYFGGLFVLIYAWRCLCLCLFPFVVCCYLCGGLLLDNCLLLLLVVLLWCCFLCLLLLHCYYNLVSFEFAFRWLHGFSGVLGLCLDLVDYFQVSCFVCGVCVFCSFCFSQLCIILGLMITLIRLDFCLVCTGLIVCFVFVVIVLFIIVILLFVVNFVSCLYCFGVGCLSLVVGCQFDVGFVVCFD